jgi:hypothetical protein
LREASKPTGCHWTPLKSGGEVMKSRWSGRGRMPEHVRVEELLLLLLLLLLFMLLLLLASTAFWSQPGDVAQVDEE